MQANIDKKRTILENLRRNAREGKPGIHHISPDDLRYKTWEEDHSPIQRGDYSYDGHLRFDGLFWKILRSQLLFLDDPLLRRQYEKVEIVFLAHHTEAKEVTEEEFLPAEKVAARSALPLIWKHWRLSTNDILLPATIFIPSISRMAITWPRTMSGVWS